MARRVLFIINPAAGAGRATRRWVRLEQELVRRGISFENVFTQGPDEAAQIARKSARDFDLMMAVGGDGTISEIADGILSSHSGGTALGVVPFGTGNDMASTAGIHNERDAIRALPLGSTRVIDVIAIHCLAYNKPISRYALAFAGVGIVSELLRKTTRAAKEFLGQRLAY